MEMTLLLHLLIILIRVLMKETEEKQTMKNKIRR